MKADLENASKGPKAPSGLQKTAEGNTDYSEDFFGREAFLAVSGQLNAEAYACALSDVYTFGELTSILDCRLSYLCRAHKPLVRFDRLIRIRLHSNAVHGPDQD